MAEFDRELESRVWKRVQGKESAVSLQQLAAAELSSAAVFLLLSKTAQGIRKEQLRRLYHRQQAHVRRLRGIQLVREGVGLAPRTAPPAQERWEVALCKCYSAALQAAQAYEKQSDDPQFGCVFAQLAQEERENCTLILEILGD